MQRVETYRGTVAGWIAADAAVLSPDAAARRLWLHRCVRGDRFAYRLASVAPAAPVAPSPRRRRAVPVAVPAFAAVAAFGACLAFGVASNRIGARIVAAPSARAAASLAAPFAATATGAGAAFAVSVAAMFDAIDARAARRRRRAG